MSKKSVPENKNRAKAMKLRRVLGHMSPDTKDKLMPAPGVTEAAEIMEEARKAFGLWAKVPLCEKALFMETLAGEILALDSKLIKWMVDESGLTANEAYAERLLGVRLVLRMAGILRDGMDNELFEIPGVGPVLIFGTYECPCTCGMLGLDVISAITAGCPVIYVTPSQTPGTEEMLNQAFERASAKFSFPFRLIQRITEDDMAVITPLLESRYLAGAAVRRGATKGPNVRRIVNRRPDDIPFFTTSIRHRLRTDLSMIRRWMRG
jgi:alpha-ketoglutaric semialdehyde dehydrogenase